ncbi:hypothetical protein [Kitasatospora sp. NPDC059327]|uniref:hypothetical protein n=1 Tax=Kitasatospora sp. NPDC059327 TaxID=3346803 RepID=UPI003674BBE5
MSSAATRWTIAVLGSVVAFGALLGVGRLADFGWLPDGEAGWGVLSALAAVGAAGVLAALGWWASQTTPSPAPTPARTVDQRAEATDRAQVEQVAGHRFAPGAGGAAGTGGAPPTSVQQNATAGGDARIVQTGGDQYQ